MKILRPALSLLLMLSALLGLAYPVAVTGLAQRLFPQQANGSVITRHGQANGSSLIGQEFKKPGYFWSRPSATGDHPYNGQASGGSNLGNANPALADAVRVRMTELKRYPTPAGTVPVDLVTASASGLDPHITPAAAYYQVPRIAGARHLDPARVSALISQHTEPPWIGLLGEPRVNVLALNMALDAL